ncbi:NAD(P) transhydrogenase subunit alpha [Parvularcula dongshanensis]|uniref:proton-translocating NAD(P)(+) transhydrogenase n=1 Tax=Parvularcula dongshanensis TaxID=1173995 RepID=A0A840I4Q4_9PROT|nr:NAD(P) transhydrogenase subunit alpha [Parvularcula dongshanensis]
MTKIAVLRAGGDARVAATPDTVKKMTALGLDVSVEPGAGARAGLPDSAYEAAGATVGGGALDGADAALVVEAPLGPLPRGLAVIGLLDPYAEDDRAARWAEGGVDAYAMELVPRITRAQSMDVLSSQANLAGYKAVIDAAGAYGRAFPMMMTAAGTVPPAKVFVMGAGVAGLQAIATAKRLGAVVSATDVRYAAKEQVESLGGTFVTADLEAMKAMETKGGYAKEASEDFQKKQAEHVKAHLAKMDVVITTALIPGRPAPKLITQDMLSGMKPGSVLVDLAAPRGGNVEGEAEGVTVVRPQNILEGLPGEASNLYARNLLSFLTLIYDKETGALKADPEDEIVRGTQLTRNGERVHERFAPPRTPVETDPPRGEGA